MRLFFALLISLPLIASEGVSQESTVRPKTRPVVNAPVLVELKRPARRPEGFETTARNPAKGLLGKLFGSKTAEPKRSKKGSVCGDAAIRGQSLKRVRSKVVGCGIAKPVRVTAVDGVKLSAPATLDCQTARALRTWVTKALKPAFGKQDVVELRVAAHYACRPRNNKRGARISEHGRGKAIDISAVKLASGKELTVLRDYRKESGLPLRKSHKAACGIFGTTLGPGSDGHHKDHLHLDTASYRSGPYCK